MIKIEKLEGLLKRALEIREVESTIPIEKMTDPETKEFFEHRMKIVDQIIRGLNWLLKVFKDGYGDLPPEEIISVLEGEDLKNFYRGHKKGVERLEKEHNKIKDAVHEGMEELGKLVDKFERTEFPITYGTGKKTH